MEGEPEQAFFHSRRSFRRQNSSLSPDGIYVQAPQDEHELRTYNSPEWEEAPVGLNISGLPRQVKRVPVGSKSNSFTSKDGSTTLVTTPEPLFSGNHRESPYQEAHPHGGDGRSFNSDRSSYSRLNQSTSQDFSAEAGLLRTHVHDENCPTHGDILTSPWSWWTISVLALAVYSTVFSGVFLGIAFAKPRWGENIGTDGHITFSNATLLSALMSKTVELSFVTIFVALLGQMLSRRAFAKENKNSGISIAEMTMRSWVMQPGTLITNWIAVRYAASTVVGVLVLISALAATFYTTAAEALVAPKPKFGSLKHRVLYGQVAASYANAPYLAQTCQSPIKPGTIDPVLGYDVDGDTCLQIDYAGQSYHNLKSFLVDWSERLDVGNRSDDQTSINERPAPISTLFDNTTLLGQWITPSHENFTADSYKYQRLVQNVTLAMPHANLFNAARDPKNHILQPEDLQGNGEYFIQAAIPAPTINVLCAGLNETEVLAFQIDPANTTDQYIGPTAVDDIFNFGNDGPLTNEMPPYFPIIPIEYNIVGTNSPTYGYSAVYVLAKPPSVVHRTYLTSDYVLCAIKSTQYPNCTTYYHAAQSGGEMSVQCDNRTENTMPYRKSVPSAIPGHWEPDWKDIGAEWVRAVSLNSGISKANASNDRLLTQFIPPYDNTTGVFNYLPQAMPTIGEALAVLAGSTAVLASSRSPFVHFWNYSQSSLEEPQYQNFRAMVSYKDYASGGTQEWQGLFYVVLVAVFLLSCFSLVYLLWTFCLLGRVTDYTEPQNLFALAINSPPSSTMSGTCGPGPSGGLLAKKWEVDMQKSGESPTDRNLHPHFYVRCKDDTTPVSPSKSGRKRRSKPPTIASFSISESPAVEQYMRLSGK
ncbi:hypothetical protein H2200_009901 [Cladophialophora chaetospira]|uniref:Uncharacterized protein n=1 Tax=Cladophialophora chaetospira TaxID=386627 RepID=A0AA38X1V5_9EURO|nr:hypothetical protein H2200_009901 [Cladophialophora chaetospira]